MIDPKHDRLNYGNQLIPPVGYELCYAIGTTYSLDLNALLALPVALFYAQEVENNTDTLRYDILEAISKASGKIRVFYQNGQLKVPKKYHFLMAYLEKGVQPINMENHFSSFHPKIWVARYEKTGSEPIYKVLVTSRNLTFSRDWDMAFATEGKVTKKSQAETQPLVHFIQFLLKQSTEKISPEFVKDLERVKFDTPHPFESFSFQPIGIPMPGKPLSTYQNQLTNGERWKERIIMSPFLHEATLSKHLVYTQEKPVLFSRSEELDKMPRELLQKFESCWSLSPFIVNGEFNSKLEDAGAEPINQSLHAKFFVGTIGWKTKWCIGSANATTAASERNIEFMVELIGGRKSGVKFNDVLDKLTAAEKDSIPLFVPYSIEDHSFEQSDDQDEKIIRELKFQLSRLSIKGKALTGKSDRLYDLLIEVDASQLKVAGEYEVRLKPLPELHKQATPIKPGSINSISEFGNYQETSLSIFLILEIWKGEMKRKEFLLPMDIDLPPSRLNKIFSTLINSSEKFLRYLTFLLTGEENSIISDTLEEVKHEAGTDQNSDLISGIPVYEKLLIASSRFPNKLKGVDSLIQRIKSEQDEGDEHIVPEKFEKLWSVFQAFIKDSKL